MDENFIVPYICKTLNDIPLAIAIASRNNLPGADELFVQQFNGLFQAGDYAGAAKVALESPRGMLRTTQTIQRFKSAPALPGAPTPLLQYFSVLLEKGTLNQIESLELARPVLQQGRRELLEKWLNEDKLGCSEELGDLVRQLDPKLALQVYYKAEVHGKFIYCLAESGQFDKIVAYAKKVDYNPDWLAFLRSIPHPAGVLQLATMLLIPDEMVDINSVLEIFLQRQMFEGITSLLLDYLKDNKPEHALLQTRLLEINLNNGFGHIAEAILKKELITHYDRPKIARSLEKAGLYQRALQHYTELSDIRRVIINTHAISSDFLVNYFTNLDVNDTLTCLKDLMAANKNQNLSIVVAVAIKFSDLIGPAALIALFESFNSYHGTYSYLNQVVNFSQDADVHFKYIEAAVKVNQLSEVERIVQESQFYDPVRVKEFLKESKLSDQVPLIIVCDRHGFVDDLTSYLYKNNLTRYIEVYLQKVNASQTPAVIGALLDADCNEEYIKSLLKLVGDACPVAELVEQVTKRNRTKIIANWLDERIQQGNVEPATHNAMAFICIDLNKDAENFLLKNPYYDSIAVGKYCETRDPHLAVIAYKRGLCSNELIAVTNANGLFRNQARYLVERKDAELWSKVLHPENEFRRKVIDQIITVAVPESSSPKDVIATVKAFMAADLPKELIELLEKIILETTNFSGNKYLQNLLLVTAIRSEPSRLMKYIQKLDNYDDTDVANIAIDAGLFEEALAIYKKSNYNSLAISVLIDHLQDLDRAAEFADRVNEAEVYSKLAQAQLNRNLVKQAIDSFIKAQNHEFFQSVIASAQREDLYADLVRFLLMCRTKTKDPTIETELAYSYAKTNNLRDLDEMVSGPTTAHVQNVGDRCFNESLYEAAKILFNSISNYARLATTHVKLGDYSAGVDAASKAGNSRTWKEVCLACVDAKQFRLAQICGLHIIVRPDELEDLIVYYENGGNFEEIIALLEGGLIADKAHPGLFTELAILYSKYKPEKLMDHLRLFHGRMNMLKVLRVCEKNYQWPELTFLYVHYKEYDNAATVMMEHSTAAWEHPLFKEILPKCNVELYYKAVQFYLEEHPLSVNDLLSVLATKIDHARCINLVRRLGHLPIIKPYLLSVQSENNLAVNNAVNDLYFEEEDFVNLKRSIDSFDNIDSLDLAQRLEQNSLLEFRRISAYLFKKNKKFKKSIDISKEDKLWKDAIETAGESANRDITEQLLEFFVQNDRKDCFAALLYSCFDHIRPDVALEYAWRYNMTDFAMPFLIQTMRNFTTKINKLEDALAQKDQQNQPQFNLDPNNYIAGPPPGMIGVNVDPNQFLPSPNNNNNQSFEGFYPPGPNMGGAFSPQPFGQPPQMNFGVDPSFGQPSNQFTF